MDVRVLQGPATADTVKNCVIDGIPGNSRVYAPVTIAARPNLSRHGVAHSKAPPRHHPPSSAKSHRCPGSTGQRIPGTGGCHAGTATLSASGDRPGCIGPIERMLILPVSAIVASSRAYIAKPPVLREHADRCLTIPFGIDPDKFDARHIDQSLLRNLRRRFGPRDDPVSRTPGLLQGNSVSYPGDGESGRQTGDYWRGAYAPVPRAGSRGARNRRPGIFLGRITTISPPIFTPPTSSRCRPANAARPSESFNWKRWRPRSR